MRSILFWICFISLPAKGQAPSLFFEKLTMHDGLSHNKVNCILQDRRGFTWIGTEDGLNRYDGKHFVHFRHKTNDTTSISGNIITGLLEDKDGLLWITTGDGGLSRYDHRLPSDKQFRQFKHNPSDPSSIPVNTINTLLEDNTGNLWLGTSSRSVIRFNKKTGKFDDITNSGKTILDLCMDGNGKIWVGRHGGGIMKIDPVTLKTEEDSRYLDLYAKLPHVTVTAFLKDADGHMWFGSWDKALYKWNNKTGQKEIFPGTNDGFIADEVLSFAEDKTGTLWIGGKEKGLQVYHKAAKRFFSFQYDPSKEGSVSSNRINCIYIDKNGTVWMGTNRGLNINNPYKQQFIQQFLKKEANATVNVFDYFEDDDGSVWLGTNQGIFTRHKDGTITHKEIIYNGRSLHIGSFLKEDDGTVYLGTNYSLFKYNPATNSVSLLPNTGKDGVMRNIIESRVVSIIKDRIDGMPVLMVLPYGHYMAYYDLERKRWVSRLDSMNIVKRFGLKDNLLRKFYRTKDGSLFIATAKQGLGKWDHASPGIKYSGHDPADITSLANNDVYDLAEDARGNLWVSTYGGGLHYYDVKKNSFNRIGESNNIIEGLAVDKRERVWMISNGNLYRYDPVKKTFTGYHLPDIERSGGLRGKVFRDREGNIYVSGNNYYVKFHPDSILETGTLPKPSFTDFLIFNRSYSHLLQEKKIKLRYKDSYFTFQFAAPDYSIGNRVLYSYKLEGFDEDWVNADERNFVSYSNLEGGDYEFKVRATNVPGKWDDEYTSIKLSVIPPFWKRYWFYFACAVILLLVSYLVYRYRINELLNRQAIRNKIAQDLHDNVGSTLSSISVYSQVAKIYHQQSKDPELHTTLEKISSTSSEMISELNDTVWAINPRNDNMEVIIQRMQSFAKPLLASQGIQFHATADPKILGINLEMEKRKNFYLIFKEAVNNVLKYAGCKTVKVDIRQKSNYIRMSIGDDGAGFDLSKTSEGYKSSDIYGGGNGLKNMQRRAKEMKGNLKIYSEPGQGTRIDLVFPIT